MKNTQTILKPVVVLLRDIVIRYRTRSLLPLACACSLIASTAIAQTGPFPATNWPESIDTNAVVDYCILDPNAGFATPIGWNNTLSVAPDHDQMYMVTDYDGLFGDQATNSSGYMNIADQNWTAWANVPVIDVLIQIYGNKAVSINTNLSALEGQVGANNTLVTIPITPPSGSYNAQWNWMLLSVTNSTDQFGYRTVGDTSFNVSGGGEYGGINDGTIRFQNMQ